MCRNCNTGKVEDEIHFLLTCSTYKEIRKKFISGKLLLNRNQISSNKLMNMHKISDLKTCKFLKNCLSKKGENS